jgi:hypothetical protein
MPYIFPNSVAVCNIYMLCTCQWGACFYVLHRVSLLVTSKMDKKVKDDACCRITSVVHDLQVILVIHPSDTPKKVGVNPNDLSQT